MLVVIVDATIVVVIVLLVVDVTVIEDVVVVETVEVSLFSCASADKVSASFLTVKHESSLNVVS